MKYPQWALVLAVMASMAACNPQPAARPTPTQIAAVPAAPTTRPASPTPSRTASLPEHRIGVRVVNGVGEFYDRISGEKFVPRGNNFIRLAPQRTEDGSTQVYHSVFDPGRYDRVEIAGHMGHMRYAGYNMVRVFVSQNTIGSPAGGLSEEYMHNVADFLRLAKENEVYVIITQDWLPGGKYGALINQDCCDVFNYSNAGNLPPGAVKAYQVYYSDFIQALAELGAPTDQIFSYQLRNEFYYDTDQPPLSLNSGEVLTANGKTYDMASQEDKQRMVKENLVYWIDAIRATILRSDPTALVSIGFFVPQGPNLARMGDTRLAVTEPAIWESQADFIDLHAYPGFELNLQQHVENFGVNGMEEKPIIMGELGAHTGSYATAAMAANALMDWQVESCAYGFDGWLLWTWDLPEQGEFYNALSSDGEIARVLAPHNRPDPCVPGEGLEEENNLALGSSARASSSLADSPAGNALDGLESTVWNAGAGPPQWIEIDLGQAHNIRTIRLMVAQSPDGLTEHQLYVGEQQGDLLLLHTFSGETGEGSGMEFFRSAALERIRFIRIVTLISPSWVAWREIEVIGE